MVRYIMKMYRVKKDLVTVRLKRIKRCLTIRQWAVLCGILCLILSAILALFANLITTHNKHILELIDKDFENERAKHKQDDPLTSNEIKLMTSQEDVNWIRHEMDMYFWAAYVDLLSTVFLCIGISINNMKLVIQWLVSSIILFSLVSCFVFSHYIKVGTSNFLDQTILGLYLVLGPFFFVCWSVIILYCVVEKMNPEIEKSKENVVKSEGGLKHVVTIPEKSPL